MKLICDGLDLSDAVLKVSKALAVKSANPVLEGIKLSCKGDSLTLTASDTELTIEKTIKADVLMEGETVVVGKYFVDFVKKLEKEQVELSRLYDGGLQIKYSDSVSELQVYPVENYPVINKEGADKYFELKTEDFKKIVRYTTLSCSTDDSRPILKGCLFEVENNNLTCVSLDGFRMSVCKKEVKASDNIKAIISSRALNEVERLLEKEENITVHLGKNLLFVEFSGTAIYSRLIEGEFVKYNHILPTSFANDVKVNKEAFSNSIDRASIVAKNDKYNIVKFDIKENVMGISSKSEVGTVNENVNITLKGKDLTIAFNGKYLIDFIKTVEDEYIELKLNSPIDPCIMSIANKEDFMYLVLPVRISG